MKKVLIVAIGTMATAWATACPSLAQAADLPYTKSAPSNYDYPPAFTWSGAYLGANAGVGIGAFTNGGQQDFGSRPIGGLYGFTGGYNYQQGKLVVGGEGDFAFGHVADAATPYPGVVSTGVVENFFTVRGRVGYAMDRLLIFGTGGYAGADVRGALSGRAPSGSYALDQTRVANGWTLGLGLEYAITPHFSAKAEYLYASMGNNNYFGGTPGYVSNGVNLNILRAGVNYHF